MVAVEKKSTKRALGHWWHDPTSSLRQSVNPERTQWRRARVVRQLRRPDIGHTARAHPNKKLTAGRRWAAGLTRSARRMPLSREVFSTLWNLMFANVRAAGGIWDDVKQFLRSMTEARRKK